MKNDLLTEREASARLCCVTLADKCVASGCMGWRWHDQPTLSVEMKSARGAQPIEPHQRRGYCGRAGKVEE